jgi:phage repressor protein C with HTH and peptisase S24 domain
MSLGLRLKLARLERGITQTELAECVGVSQAAIAGLELRESTKSGYTSQIAECLKVNVQWLATGIGEMNLPEPTLVIEIPLVAWSDIHRWQEADPIKWIPWHTGEDENVSQTFALKISGVSMEPEFHDGDNIVIDPNATAAHNDFVIVGTATEPMLRQLVVEGGRSFARALNPAWTPQLEQIEADANIIGVVRQKSRDY